MIYQRFKPCATGFMLQNGYVLSLFLCLFKQGTPNDEANVENIWQFDRFLMRYGLIEQKNTDQLKKWKILSLERL
ncbi:hypothetical protein D3C87_632900 [compost metagenome]